MSNRDLHPAQWPSPTDAMLGSRAFEAVWQRIKHWDINVPDVYAGYMGATGSHVRAILDALAAAGFDLGVPREAACCTGSGVDEAVDRLKRAATEGLKWAATEAKARLELIKGGVWNAQPEVLHQVMESVTVNRFLMGLEENYANYSEIELKLVDPRTVTHITRDQRQNLSEVMDAPAAIAIIVTQKNCTATPVYYPLKVKPSPAQISAIEGHFIQAVSKGNLRMLSGESN